MGLISTISNIRHAWNVFTSDDFTKPTYGYSSWTPAYKTVTRVGSASIVSSIYNRIAIDVSMAKIQHVKVDKKTEDVTIVESGLNYCLGTEANLDQTGIQCIQDLVYSMFDEGVVALVPVETTINPKNTGSWDVETMRVGKITDWLPDKVTILLYNEQTGQNEHITLPKRMVAIIENPLYAVMNAENSTLKRLITKISQLDENDAASSSGRLDAFIQVPFSIKTEQQRINAEKRIQAIESMLTKGKHGITYIDATEKLTQLNRPINSQLPETVDRLTKQLYNELGLTEAIFNGTANEEQLRVYYSRTVDPIIENIVAELKRKFLTKTARTQGHDIQYFRDMFKFVTIEMLAGLGDSVRRNSILSSNEMRKILGHKASKDPRADELFNPNIADKNQNIQPSPSTKPGSLTSPDQQKSNE